MANALQTSDETLEEDYELAGQSIQHLANTLCIGFREVRRGISIDLTSHGLRRQTVGGLCPRRKRIVSAHIDRHLAGPILIRDLAQLVRLSAAQFSRVFRVSFGESPRQYVMRTRIERAQALILTSSAPLSQIALDCGLYDQPYLTKQFRRLVGAPPASWRRAIQLQSASKQTATRR